MSATSLAVQCFPYLNDFGSELYLIVRKILSIKLQVDFSHTLLRDSPFPYRDCSV